MKRKQKVYAASILVLIIASALTVIFLINGKEKCQVINNRNTCAYKNNRCTDPDGPMAHLEPTIDCAKFQYYDPALDPDNK